MEPREQQVRKLAAIMFTDMVGYSKLTQKNEALALELLDEHRRIVRPILASFKGKEIETAGDSFFVEFESALEATQCAIQIQKALFDRNAASIPERQILIRIGLHIGDVIHMGKHVHSDGVNIAARIEPFARPGGICLSEDVARQIENKIELALIRLGKGELKNIRLPMNIYRIIMPWERTTSGSWDRVSFLFSRRKITSYTTLAAVVVIVAAVYSVATFLLGPADTHSIAVLPFQNRSDDKEGDYFSDGMTDEVIGQLSKIRALKVTSRTSVMQYKKRDVSVPDIGRELNVAYVLEGSVRKSGNQVRILAQLIDARSDQYLLTEQYDEVMTHIFDIQTDVALKIAKALEARISPAEIQRLASRPTDNLEAYDLYLKGRNYWSKRLPDKLHKGIELFKEAIAKDPNYGLAYAGLADSYTILGNFNLLPPLQTYPEAKAAAEKALQLDNSLAEAHASLGFTIMNYDWDWVAAERELKRAIQINPNYAIARSWHAFLLTILGRFDDAASIRLEALKLDPFSPDINADVGLTLYFARRYDEAIAQFKKTLEIDPTFVLVYIPLGGAYVQKKMYDEAIRTYQNFTIGLAYARIRHPIPFAALTHAYAESGRTEDALNMLELVEEMASSQYVSPYWMGVLSIGLGRKDQALAWLEKAFDDRDGSMVLLKVDPVFDSIRSDPRFTSLIKRMRFD